MNVLSASQGVETASSMHKKLFKTDTYSNNKMSAIARAVQRAITKQRRKTMSPEEIRAEKAECSRAYDKKNAAALQAKRKQYRQQNKEMLQYAEALYREDNRERLNIKKRMWNRKQRIAKLEADLTAKQIIIPQNYRLVKQQAKLRAGLTALLSSNELDAKLLSEHKTAAAKLLSEHKTAAASDKPPPQPRPAETAVPAPVDLMPFPGNWPADDFWGNNTNVAVFEVDEVDEVNENAAQEQHTADQSHIDFAEKCLEHHIPFS